MKKLQIARLGVQTAFLVVLFTPFSSMIFKVMGLILLATIFAGAFYCGWMCPVGAINDLTEKISEIFGIKRVKIPRKIIKYARFTRYGFFILLMFGIHWFLQYDARKSLLGVFKGTNIGTAALIVLAIFLVSSIFVERLFCNFFCYEGAKYGMLSLARILLVRRDKEACIDCKKCSKACPMNIQVAEVEEVRDAHCINCFNCISDCPKKGAIKFGFTNFKKWRKIDIGAVFLAIAFIIFTINMMGSHGGR